MKYKLYRSFGDLDKDVKKHELVAVEYGSTIEDVEDALIKDVADDLAVTPNMLDVKHLPMRRKL